MKVVRYAPASVGLTVTALDSNGQEPVALVDIKTIDPTIVVALRYASPNNITGRVLYPPGTRALVRPEVAQRLAGAQTFLRRYQYQLKIWDAYRPPTVQFQLWQDIHSA